MILAQISSSMTGEKTDGLPAFILLAITPSNEKSHPKVALEHTSCDDDVFYTGKGTGVQAFSASCFFLR